jgi:hypothetical protein
MDVLCVGMYRSGSTWQYDVACHVVERFRQGRRLGYVPGERYVAGNESWRVLKAHDFHPRFARALAENRAVALSSFRDLRDVAYSLMHKHAGSFEDIIERKQMLHLCLHNDRSWRVQPGTLRQRYEDILDRPIESVTAIARHVGASLGDDEAAAVAKEYSLEENRRRAARGAEQLRFAGVALENPANALRWDPETLLHWNHIREGRIGGWKEQATPRELAVLAGLCASWLIDHGYENDLSWALPGLEHFAYELAKAQRALREARQKLDQTSRQGRMWSWQALISLLAAPFRLAPGTQLRT